MDTGPSAPGAPSEEWDENGPASGMSMQGLVDSGSWGHRMALQLWHKSWTALTCC